jgi:phosphoribosyl 1,2-cyclic phosphate phosphodiesterase
MLYAVEMDGRCIFYGTDTDALPEAVWQAFGRLRLRFDLVVLDHTYGHQGKQGSDHMSASQVIEHFARMRREALLAPNARTFATHIAHDANPAHPELVELARGHGYEIGYDGLTLEL